MQLGFGCWPIHRQTAFAGRPPPAHPLPLASSSELCPLEDPLLAERERPPHHEPAWIQPSPAWLPERPALLLCYREMRLSVSCFIGGCLQLSRKDACYPAAIEVPYLCIVTAGLTLWRRWGILEGSALAQPHPGSRAARNSFWNLASALERDTAQYRNRLGEDLPASSLSTPPSSSPSWQ